MESCNLLAVLIINNRCMKFSIKVMPVLTLFITVLFLSFSLLSCEQGPPKTKGKTQAQRGKELFDQYCVSCHGAHGDGVDAAKLKVTPPESTKITYRRRAKTFPVAEIARFIDGRQFAKSHGDREMPIWGEVFLEKEKMSVEEMKGKLGDIIGYLISIQE